MPVEETESLPRDPLRPSPLDRFAYLQGCWRFPPSWFRLGICWHRELAAWIGVIKIERRGGPEEEIELHIRAFGETVFLLVHGDDEDSLFMTHVAPLHSIAERHVSFGFSRDDLELTLTVDRAGDVLNMRWPERYSYALHRQ